MRLFSNFLVRVPYPRSAHRWCAAIGMALGSFSFLFGQPRNQTITLDVPATVRVGDLVTLTASFEGAPSDVRYRFVYSDRTASESDWQKLPVTIRNFISTGDITVYVEAQTPPSNNLARFAKIAQQNFGYSRSEAKRIQVLPSLPTIALRTLTKNARAGQPVQWTISRTPKNLPLHYQFDPGDNTGAIEATAATIEHTYPTAGNFTASVTLLDVESAPRSRAVVRVAPAPAPTLTADPATAEIGEAVVLTAGYPASNNTARFRFQFGDHEPPSSWSNRTTIEHSYPRAGSYAAFVEVTHEKGNDTRPEARSAPREVVVRPALSVSLEVSTARAYIGDEISFKLASNRPDLRPQFTLDFGDGEKQTVSEAGAVLHVFKQATAFDVTVVATAKTGRATAQQRITIAPAPSPSLDVSPATAEINGIVQFTANYARVSQFTRYRFSFGDGSPRSPWLASPRVSRRYAQSGLFSASVEVGIVSNAAPNGAPFPLGESFPRKITIRPALAVKIQAASPQIRAGEEAVFTVTTNREDLATNYAYAFSDGMHSAPSTATSASHIFLQAGEYTAAVSATSPLPGTANDAVHFAVLAPAAPKLTAEPASPEIGELVKFTALPASSGSQFRYRFNFGDKTPLSDWLATPVIQHAYQQKGVYQPSVEVGVVRGQKTENLSTGAETSVTVPPPFDFSLLPASGEIRAGRTITFERKTNRPQTPKAVSVDFGDGSPVETFSPDTPITHNFSRRGSYPVKWTADAGQAPRARGDFILVVHSSVSTWIVLLVSLIGAISVGLVPHHFGWIVPSLHPKPNLHTMKVEAKAVPSAEMEIRLNRNLPSLRSTVVVKIKPRVDAPEKLHV